MLFVPLGIAALIATAYAQHNPEWTEQVYGQTVYPVLSTAVAFLPSLVRFSLMEWVTLLFILFCLGYIVYYVRKIILCKSKKAQAEGHGTVDAEEAAFQASLQASTQAASQASLQVNPQTNPPVSPPASPPASPQTSPQVSIPVSLQATPQANPPASSDTRLLILYHGVTGLIAILCVVYFVFTALCGLNYHRYTFTAHTGYALEESSVEELKQLCMSLAADMTHERELLGADTDLSTPEEGAFEYYAAHSVETMQRLAEDYPVLNRDLYSAPKPVIMSELMSDAGIGGMFFPFTMESNINAQVPFFNTPSNMAHELAHQCGFMREDEANFIAYLSCKKSDEPLMRYSGLLMAFNYSVSALYKVDKEAATEILAGLSETVQHDRAQSRQFWLEHEGMINDISRDINDAYLRSNNQTDGVQSYGRMVDLLLAEQRAAA